LGGTTNSGKIMKFNNERDGWKVIVGLALAFFVVLSLFFSLVEVEHTRGADMIAETDESNLTYPGE